MFSVQYKFNKLTNSKTIVLNGGELPILGCGLVGISHKKKIVTLDAEELGTPMTVNLARRKHFVANPEFIGKKGCHAIK